MKLPGQRDPWTIVVYVATVFLVFAGAWYGSRAETLRETTVNTAQGVRYNDPAYPLISPLVSIAIPNATGFSELNQAKSDVQKIIDTAKKQGKVGEVGVYFRLPVNAHWFGINENGMFDPGSLIKVPIMLAYLKEAENNPAVLDQLLPYDPSKSDPLPNALPATLPSGSYTAERLIQAMILNSDNVAKDVLTDSVAPKDLQDVFDETDSNFLKSTSGTISPKQYIIIMARIYSATYLNREYSNYAMELLTKTTFTEGLTAGLPAKIKVAHKYGERGIYEDNVLAGAELHDCGLIYAPDNPYYLCVMSRGTDINALATLIRDISQTVYNDRMSFKP